MAKKNFLNAKAARLLRRVIKHIKKEPLRYDQNIWRDKDVPGDHVFDDDFIHNAVYPECGTRACLGGWLNILTGAKTDKQLMSYIRACKQIGLDPADRAHALFGYNCNWPQPFRRNYEKAKTPKKRAAVAEKRVEHFIKTGE